MGDVKQGNMIQNDIDLKRLIANQGDGPPRPPFLPT